MSSKSDPSRWAVSRSRNNMLARSSNSNSSSGRFNTLTNAVRDLSSEDEIVLEIDKLWGEAQEKFLAIGRYLVEAKRNFHRSYEAKILPQLPFGRGVAYQLRAIALAVDEGRLLEEEMPRSYATTYQLISLPPSHFDLARKENLVRRDVMRREVEAFRTKLKSQTGLQDRALLIKERERLELDMARLAKRLAELDNLLAE